MTRNPAPSSLGTALAGIAIAMTPLHAGVVFSESFEAPVVTGFDNNTVPSNGNWIGSSGAYLASERGLCNEAVVWPATPPFTTPYGQQGYSLRYSTTMLTTAQGATGQTITADVTYTLTFHAARPAGATANYLAHLVAFDVADDNAARQNPNSMAGTIVAQATGTIAASDMSDLVTIVFTPDASHPHLGKELGIRFDKASGNAIYDNVRLIVGHDLNPDPADGEDLDAGGNVTLSWTNMPPNTGDTYVDVWFGNTSGALSQVVDGQTISSTIVSAPSAGTWYWRVDSYPDGDPNGTPVVGQEFSFTIADTDGDGIPDTWEQQYFGGPTSADAGLDSDTDGLSNLDEYIRGTNPGIDDTDGDGLLDGVESATGTWVSASDTGTLPLVGDTDVDGLLDGVETNTGIWAGASNTGTSPVDNDWDKDGLLDGAETNTGTLVDKTNTGTNPYISDTDNDGAGDYYEVYASFTSPFDDTDKPLVPYPLPDPDGSTGDPSKPVKVFICSGQSNMVGLGNVGPLGTPGTLETITKIQNKFPNLIDGSGAWTERQDVRYRGVISATANGPLTAGQGAGTGNLGPELGFGHIMGHYLDEAVLVLKSSIGNRSLGWDILPAGSPSYQYGTNNYAGYGGGDQTWPIGGTEEPWAPGGWYAGYEWDRYFLDESEWAHPHDAVTNVVDILDNWSGEYGGSGKPFEGRDFEIAGFVWWQGDKDRYDMGYATRYEQNLVNLINNLRSYYSNRYPGKVPVNAPFVLATLGQTVLGDTSNMAEKEILDAQLAVDGDAGIYPEYENNVKTVYANPLSQGGASNSHYNGNAETYMLVGDALGRAMIDLLEASAGPDELPPVVIGRSPEIGETGVSAGVNIVVNFNEPVAIGSGNITLHPIDDSGDVVISVTDGSQVSISNNTLTINPSGNLATSKEYAVLIDADAIDDLAGNSFAGILVDTEWRFTTATPDTADPTLSSTDPANGATVTADTNLEATFSEPIAIGSGNITLRNLTDGPGGDVNIAITDGSQISVSGSVLTINPAADLLLGKDYAVRIDVTAIDDLVGNSFAGIGDDTTWFFSTPAPPPPNVVFFDDFEAGGNPSTLPATSGGYSNNPDVETYTLANTSQQINTALWVRATSGYKASQNGLIDESENSGNSFTDPVGSQAWAGRYSSNTGVTTAEGVIGTLSPGQTITVSFDAVIDGFNSGSAIYAMLVAFDSGAARNAVEDPKKNTAAVLKLLTGAAASSYQNYSFSYTVGENVTDNNGGTSGGGTAWLESLLGKDIAVRFAHRNGAIVDNVQVTISGGGGGGNPYATWAGGPWSGTLTDASATLDFDRGGLATGLEWVLGGDPTDGGDDAGLMPTIDASSDPDGKLLFVFRRSSDAAADTNTTITVEYGSDLGGWTAAVHQGSGPGDITISEVADGFAAGVDQVTVALPASLSNSGKLFARLVVAVGAAQP